MAHWGLAEEWVLDFRVGGHGGQPQLPKGPAWIGFADNRPAPSASRKG